LTQLVHTVSPVPSLVVFGDDGMAAQDPGLSLPPHGGFADST